jgi:hypothetical protein
MTSGTTRDTARSVVSDRPLLFIGHRHGSSWPQPTATETRQAALSMIPHPGQRPTGRLSDPPSVEPLYFKGGRLTDTGNGAH